MTAPSALTDTAPQTATLSTRDRETLHAIFRHPAAQNLQWREAVALFEAIGEVEEKSDHQVILRVGGKELLMHKPHTKDLTAPDVIDLRHLLTNAGYTPDSTTTVPAAAVSLSPDLVVAISHHEAHIYRLDLAHADTQADTITPYDPHHFLHHMRHKDEDRERGQKSPEDATFYDRIAQAVAAGGRIVVIGHGKGTSNAGEHLTDYLRTHHRETYERVVSDVTADLSALTAKQLLALAAATLRKSGSSLA